ncbi:MAG: hypothetical protein LBV04_02410 [Deferribacteraceae bacterium]|jgi:hypothetical protein|nr:hypothetical protein [Deferribacteraceae bacterium]
MEALKAAFNQEMRELYQKMSAVGYTSSRFLQMINDADGGYGYGAAKRLVSTMSAGFVKLHSLGHLELSVEAYVLKSEYNSLFNDNERQVCRDRLEQCGYKF